jgi:hypothetical protein
MRTFIILALCWGAFCATDITSAASAVATNDDSVTLVSTNGFGVQFALTEEEKIFADWDKPVPPHYTPVSVARRGVPIFTVVVFAGAGLRSNGTADVTFDAVIRKPDGSVYGRDKDMVGVQGRIDPSPKALQLARDYMGIRIEPKDPAGTYTAEVVVRDNVKKLELHAKRTFTVEK